MALDHGRPRAAARLDDVGIERALHEELDRVTALLDHDLGSRLLEGRDDLPTDDLALGLRVGHASQCLEEAGPCIDGLQADAGGGDVVLLDLLALRRAVDEDARISLAGLTPAATAASTFFSE